MATDVFSTLCNYFNNAPPSLPIAIGTSPKGEGAQTKLFPLGGNGKEGDRSKKKIRKLYNIKN